KDIITIIGGIHASALPKNTLEEFGDFDFLIHGQGEVPLLELINRLKLNHGVDKIKGLAYRKDDCVKVNPPQDRYIPLDELPFPAREKLDLVKYAPHLQKHMKLPNTGIFSSIGCCFQCLYCSIHTVHPGLDMRKPENVAAEIEECMYKFGISDFRFFDDCFTLNRSRLVKLCNLIIERKLKIFWNCQSRVDKVDLELLRLMKKAGCHQITYGVEVGTEKALKIINKDTTLNHAIEAINLTKKAGIESGASFMFGIPGENEADMRQTIKFAKRLSPDIATFYILKAYPGTPVFEKEIKKQTVIQINWEDYLIHGPPVFDIGMSSERLINLLKQAYHGFYFRPGYFWQRLKKIFRSPKREVLLAFHGAKMVAAYFRRR
ncbi:MAG: B12-binding domain-containing radical SAM protein, partial [Proteobacteria bacterium]|nr:B12-binding domain-containing radical SAM protein [Pseudomonadota bacterium]